MFQSEQLQEKWKPLLEYEGCEKISDPHKRAVTAVLLENQEKFLRETSAFEQGGSLLNEAVPTNHANAAGASGGFGADSPAKGPRAGFSPVMGKVMKRKKTLGTWSRSLRKK